MPVSSKKATPQKNRRFLQKVQQKVRAYLATRTHRTFQLTRRRDYVRTLQLPGYIHFTHQVTSTLWQKRMLFLPIMLLYVVLYALLIGIGSQDAYTQISEAVKQAGSDIFGADWGGVGQSVLTLVSLSTHGLNDTMSDAQQIFGALLGLMAWLTSVWLLRNSFAGVRVKARDALYNAGAPLISTFLIALLIVIQLLPIALAAIGYAAAVSSGLLSGGVEAMLFWIAAGLLALLSVYWVTSSLFAAIIVTLPGMYPMRALKSAGSLVTGRRVRIMVRWVWMLLCVALLWGLIMVPLILFDGWLKSVLPQVNWLPVVPVAILLVSTYSIFWISTYVYMLYRKVVDDEPV